MKTSVTLFSAAACTVLLLSCGCKNQSKSSNRNLQDEHPVSSVLADSPIVAERVVVGEDTVVVAKVTEMPDPVAILASEVFDEFELIKLEDSEEALTGGGKTWVSKNHIMIWDGNNVKLFDREGKFIANVGAKGQGPGEYSIAPYYMTIDETQGKIYMMTYSAKEINTYNISDGSFLGRIPLAYDSPKGFCKIDSKNGLITVASMQFKGDLPTSPVWVQDFEGNEVSAVQRPDLALTPDFSNEIIPATTPDESQLYHSYTLITSLRPDTLYRSDGKNMHPEFTYDFGKYLRMHSFQSFPQFYVVETYGDPVMVSESSWIVGSDMPLVIDKLSLKGAPGELMIDQLGTLSLKKYWNTLNSPGYFAQSFDPGDLLDMLQAAPDSHPLANEEGIKKMEELRKTINPEGNHYVMIGHWR